MLFAESSWLGLQTLDWVVLAAYFVVIFCVGLWSMRRVHDMSDFFMGGRRFGKIFMMFFAFGAGTSSEQAVGVVAGTWRVGLAGIWWQFLWLWATPFYWIVAPVMRRMRALTTADFFQARYSSSTALLYSVYGIIMSIAFIAGGLYSSGKMVDELTGGELERVTQEWNVTVPAAKWNEGERPDRNLLPPRSRLRIRDPGHDGAVRVLWNGRGTGGGDHYRLHSGHSHDYVFVSLVAVRVQYDRRVWRTAFRRRCESGHVRSGGRVPKSPPNWERNRSRCFTS